MRFLHTADWHLGKRLHGFSLNEVQREALGRVIEIVAAEKPDAVILAGDVFDTYIPQLTALDLWEYAVDGIVGELGVPMVVIPGNHDHPERLAVHSNLAKRSGLHIIRSVRDSACPVVVAGVPIYGIPYHKPVHVNNAWREAEPNLGDFDYHRAMEFVLERVRAAQGDDGQAVVVAHAFVAGAGNEGEAEDPILVGGAGAVDPACFGGFAYVALGHIHGCRKVTERADVQAEVHYCGSPLKYSFDEAGHEKGVTLVDLGSSGEVTVERLPIAVSRDVRVLEVLQFEEVIDQAAEVAAERRDDYLLVKVSDRDPIDQALARLREWYPNALLEQPAIELASRTPTLEGDYRTLSVDDAFRQFYQHTFGEEIGGIELELMLEALDGGIVQPDDGVADAELEPTGSREVAAETRSRAVEAEAIASGERRAPDEEASG